MANLFFPQLSTGALAQFPIRKTRVARTIKNILPDGSMILSQDPYASRIEWQLSYASLPESDIAALQNHFSACAGPVHAFTFIDPTENMLVSSSDPSRSPWQSSSLISFAPNALDPIGGTAAFTVTNAGQVPQSISQSLAVPSGYQYCFSVYVRSAQPAMVWLLRSGSSVQESNEFLVGPSWSRIISAGRLNDSGTSFTASLLIGAAQQVQLYGLQLEPQIAPSAYRPTTATGGVHANAHWVDEKLAIVAEAPGLFSTAFGIETVIAA